MLKLLLCVITATVLARAARRFRQQPRSWATRTAGCTTRSRTSKGSSGNQQLQIAVYTAPNAIRQKDPSNHDLKMVPRRRCPAAGATGSTSPPTGAWLGMNGWFVPWSPSE